MGFTRGILLLRVADNEAGNDCEAVELSRLEFIYERNVDFSLVHVPRLHKVY